MAVTITKLSPGEGCTLGCRWLVESSGGASATGTITNAELCADVPAGQLRCCTSTGGLSQAQARAALLECMAMDVGVVARSGPEIWSVDVDVDGEGRPELKITAQSGLTGTAYVTLRYRHSLIR